MPWRGRRLEVGVEGAGARYFPDHDGTLSFEVKFMSDAEDDQTQTRART